MRSHELLNLRNANIIQNSHNNEILSKGISTMESRRCDLTIIHKM